MAIAEKSARHVNRVIFEGDPNYNEGKPVNQAPGHQEIEIGLCKLYQVTGEKLYLEMAQRFLDIRGVTFTLDPDGKGVMSPEYAQQHAPVADQERAVGHSVRAAYMYAGMADVGAMAHIDRYDDALDRIWKNMVDTKMHITGGLGAIHGIEGFGPEYDLPNKDAYNETCAAIANVFFNHRLFLHHRDAQYFDVAEVALLNNSLAGVNMDGDRFFYVNPLEADGIRLFNHGNAGRAPWFDCACCPSNIARIMPQVSGYMYAATDSELYCLLYGSNQTEINLAQGQVKVIQISDYPFDGKIQLTLHPETPQDFTVKLRIPTWAQDQFVPGALYKYIGEPAAPWTLTVNGKAVESSVEKGFVSLSATWTDGDIIELNLPMPLRYSVCDPQVTANCDRIAVSRGPLVYCAEETDNQGLVQRFVLPEALSTGAASYENFTEGKLNGMVKATIPVEEVSEDSLQISTMTLVPYFAWNNRGNGSMNVWFPRTKALAEAALAEASFDREKYGKVVASSCGDGDSVEALTDGRKPQNARDTTLPRWSSAPQVEGPHTVTLKFPNTQKVESLGVYWAEDGGDLAVPEAWTMEALVDGSWKPFKLYVTDFFGVDKDMYVVVHPSEDLICAGLRLTITPEPGKSVGLLDLDLMVN